MSRQRRVECGRCGAGAKASQATRNFAVRVGEKWIERFTYPRSTTSGDKAWERSEGIRLAQCIKAVLGETPFVWPTGEDSAHRMAERITGAKHVWLCDACAKAAQEHAERRHIIT